MGKEDRIEVGKEIVDIVEGTVGELKEILEPAELPPEITDDQIKQAIQDIRPEAYIALPQEVKDFIAEFSEGKRW